MTLNNSQEKFLEIMRELITDNEKYQFLNWIHSNWDMDSLPNDTSSDKILESIAEEIRLMVPFSAILPSEKISSPVCGPNSDCKTQSTVHIDEFLYNDDYVDELVDKGQLSRYYCCNCFSQNVKLLTFVSHSMSISRIKFMFEYLLPPIKNEIILDVGSRFGGVLYGAYFYTCSSNIFGVEINPDLCKIQTQILKKFNLSDRIKIVCNSILNEIELLSSADVVVLNNVFEFFTDVKETIRSWHILAQNIKPGSLLVTIPHLSETFQHIKVDFDWQDWVEELQPFQLENYAGDDETLKNHLANIKPYKVKKKIIILQ